MATTHSRTHVLRWICNVCLSVCVRSSLFAAAAASVAHVLMFARRFSFARSRPVFFCKYYYRTLDARRWRSSASARNSSPREWFYNLSSGISSQHHGVYDLNATEPAANTRTKPKLIISSRHIHHMFAFLVCVCAFVDASFASFIIIVYLDWKLFVFW